MKTPKLMIAGTHSGVGKTTVTMGLLKALSNKMKVQPYKVGPDYIDPAYHSFITGRKCRNLDSFMLDDEVIKYLFQKNMSNADIGILEGVMGLFDGLEIKSDIGSSSHVAKILNCPVLLVVDGGGTSKSLAATIKGFQDFDKDLKIEGIIINNISSKGHYDLLKEIVEFHTTAKCYGYLPKNLNVSLPSRHLGLVPSYEMDDLKNKLDILESNINETIDIDGIINLANRFNEPVNSSYIINYNSNEKIKIVVAYDKAFNFYYEDNLELLKELGGEIEFFSPLTDKELPKDIDFLYLGGGFPEVFAEELSNNYDMKKDILLNLEKGIPYFAECGGLMYLNDSIYDFDGNCYKMVGWFNGNSTMTKRLKRFGYKELTLMKDCVLGLEGEKIKVHEFHRSETEIPDCNKVYSLEKVRDGKIVSSYNCGYEKGNGIAGYPHLHFYSNINFAYSIIKTATNYKNNKKIN